MPVLGSMSDRVNTPVTLPTPSCRATCPRDTELPARVTTRAEYGW
jgi:hypothetical protein